MSWRQVALATHLEPSTLQRIVAGSVPDLPRFAALVDWMAVPADRFIRRETAQVDIMLGNGQIIEIKSIPSDGLSDKQLSHVRGAVEEIIRAIDA